MTKLDQEIQDKYFALFEVVSRLDAGLKQGTIENLDHVRSIISPAIFRPQPTRGSAPTNPATLAAKGVEV